MCGGILAAEQRDSVDLGIVSVALDELDANATGPNEGDLVAEVQAPVEHAEWNVHIVSGTVSGLSVQVLWCV